MAAPSGDAAPLGPRRGARSCWRRFCGAARRWTRRWPRIAGLPLLAPRDRAFARQLIATTLRRLGPDRRADRARTVGAVARPRATRHRRAAARRGAARVSRHAEPCRRLDLRRSGRGDRPSQDEGSGQCRAAPARARKRGADRGAGRGAAQYAGLAVAKLVRRLWRDRDARHRRGALARPAARRHPARRRRTTGRRGSAAWRCRPARSAARKRGW